MAFEGIDFTEPPKKSGTTFSGVDFTEKPATQPTVQQEEPKAQVSTVEDLMNLPDTGYDFFEEQKKVSEGQLIKFGQGLTEAFQGGKQMTLDAGENLGLVPKGATEAYTKLSLKERELINKKFKEEFGDKIQFDIAETGGKVAPFFAIPALGQTGLARTAYGAASGGLAGGAEFVEGDESRLKNVAVGAGVGAAASQLMEIVPSVRRFFAKHLTGPKTKYAEESKRLSDVTGVKFKLSQITGDAETEAAERIARNSSSAERKARGIESNQVSDAFKFWTRSLRKLDSNKADYPTRVKSAFDRVIGDSKTGIGLLGERAARAKANFAEVNKAMGGKGTVDISRLKSTISEEIARLEQRGMGGADKALSNELRSLLKSFSVKRTQVQGAIEDVAGRKLTSEVVETGDNLANISEVQNLLSRYGDAASGTGKLFTDKVDKVADSRISRRLYSALKDDLTIASQSGNPGASDLARAIKEYGEDTAKIRLVQESTLGKLFGKMDGPSPTEISKKMKSMSPLEIKESMKILKTADPEIHRGLQRFWLKEVIEGSKKKGPGEQIGFVPGKMLDLAKDNRTFKAVFSDPEARKLMRDGVAAMERISSNNLRTGGRTFARAKELAGIIASRDKTFIARLGADLFTPEVLSRAAIDPKGVKALKELGKPYNQNRWSAALVTLSNIIAEDAE